MGMWFTVWYTDIVYTYNRSPLGDPVSLGVQSALIVDQLSIQTNLILEQLANVSSFAWFYFRIKHITGPVIMYVLLR